MKEIKIREDVDDVIFLSEIDDIYDEISNYYVGYIENGNKYIIIPCEDNDDSFYGSDGSLCFKINMEQFKKDYKSYQIFRFEEIIEAWKWALNIQDEVKATRKKI